jgi:hypothetical protein
MRLKQFSAGDNREGHELHSCRKDRKNQCGFSRRGNLRGQPSPVKSAASSRAVRLTNKLGFSPARKLALRPIASYLYFGKTSYVAEITE